MGSFTLQQVATLFSKLINTTDMGQRVDIWLFYVLFGFLALALYGVNIQALGGQLISIVDKTANNTQLSDGISTIITGGPATSVIACPMNPLPNQHLFSGIPLPTWIFMIGIFVWAVMFLWEINSMLQGGKSLRERSWEWVVAPVTLLAFIIAPAFGTILDTGLYSPIMLHLIIGAQDTIKVQSSTIDPNTFGNPLWLLSSMFGIALPNGGINLGSVLGNVALSSIQSWIGAMATGDPMEMVSAILEHILSPSIIIEVIILVEAISLALEGTLLILFFNLYPLFCLAIVTNPFSLDRIAQFLKTSLYVLGGIALIMLTDVAIVLVNYQVMSTGSSIVQFAGGWFLSVLNIIILAVAIWIILKIGIEPLFRLMYDMVQEVKTVGGSVQGFIQNHSGHLPDRVKNTFDNEYQGDFKERALQRVMDIADPGGMAERTERNTPKPYKIEGYDKDIEIEVPGPDGKPPETRTVAQEHKSISFNNEGSAEWVWKLLRNEGNVNKALADIGNELPDGSVGANFKLDSLRNEIEFPNEERLNKIMDKVLRETKVYRYSKGKYINEEGTVVPESTAKRGIIA